MRNCDVIKAPSVQPAFVYFVLTPQPYSINFDFILTKKTWYLLTRPNFHRRPLQKAEKVRLPPCQGREFSAKVRFSMQLKLLRKRQKRKIFAANLNF